MLQYAFNEQSLLLSHIYNYDDMPNSPMLCMYSSTHSLNAIINAAGY